MASGLEYALVAVNRVTFQPLKTGTVVRVPNDRPSVLRVCVLGDLGDRCFGEPRRQKQAVVGCEVVTSDCTCYRWMFSRELTNTPRHVRAAVSRKHPNCALVDYTPNGGKVTQVSLRFELDHFGPVVPPGYVHQLREHWQHAMRHAKRQYPFYQYFHAHKTAFCDAPQRARADAEPLAVSCRRDFVLGIEAVDFSRQRDSVPTYVETLLWAAHLCVLIYVLYDTVGGGKEKYP
jgi:hypothetical protein